MTQRIASLAIVFLSRSQPLRKHIPWEAHLLPHSSWHCALLSSALARVLVCKYKKKRQEQQIRKVFNHGTNVS